MQTLTLTAHAKVNLALRITGRRADGYHLLDMVNVSVALGDTLHLTRREEGISLAGGGETPQGPDNLVWRAAECLLRDFPGHGVRVALEKRIPSQAGLGGGSADAAAALWGLNALWGLGLSLEALQAYGLDLGADVPYCVQGGPMRVTGVGERLQALPHAAPLYLALAKPKEGLSTAAVFAAYRMHPPLRQPDLDRTACALLEGDLAALAAARGNSLEEAAVALCPAIGQTLAALDRTGPICRGMTGSGSACFGLYGRAEAAAAAAQCLAGQGLWACATQSVPTGVDG
jgi:4-diphosphocytidyl-2-C-methyl-D-erythritol kinase